MTATYITLFFGGWLAAALFALAAFWPFCRVAGEADRRMGLK